MALAALQIVRSTDLSALRAQIGAIEGFQKPEGFTSKWVSAHIPRGSLVEIVGSGRTQLVVQILAEQQAATQALALWIESDFSVYPVGLRQKGIDLSRLLFVECDKAANWVLGQALQAQIFPFLIAADFTFQEKEMRRLQLLSERARATTFLLAKERRPSWVPQLVLEASFDSKNNNLQVHILRRRGTVGHA